MINWKAMQAPTETKGGKKHVGPSDVRPRYMSMGSWRADLSKGGVKR